jgi:CubicO group peptidase (beta-lactamase class C family)
MRKSFIVMLGCWMLSTTAEAQTIDLVDMEAFLDGAIEARMSSYDVAGVTVSVVHDGRMIFARGYGIADADGRPVVAEETLFRPGSISKTFTWTAAMQLVEQGKLDLDEPIQQYVPEIEVPNEFGQPLTMSHLMTHRPGLEDGVLGHLFVDDASEAMPLVEYLQNHPVEQVRAPGTLPSYSNWGTALAGLVIANISGERYEEYIESHILLPLAMNRSTFREPWGEHQPNPMETELYESSSKGMFREQGGWRAGSFEFISPVGPAGALSTTSTDMARFMLMHLGNGTYGAAQILQSDTARRMHSELWRPHDAMSGNFHGFFEYNLNGYSAFGHNGGTLYFMSDMVMVPELNFGFFISTNSASGAKLHAGLAEMLVKRYFPSRMTPVPEPPNDFLGRADRYTGSYQVTRRSFTKVEAIFGLAGGALNVTAHEDGYLVIAFGEKPWRFVEIATNTFRHTESEAVITFDEDGDGNISGFPTYRPAQYYEKISGFNNPMLQSTLLITSITVFVFVVVGFWLRRKRTIEQTGMVRLASIVVLLMSVLWVIWAVLTGVALADLSASVTRLMYEFPNAMFVYALTVALIATVFTLISVPLLYPVWKSGNWSRWRRIRHTLVVLLGLGTILVLNHVNAIGYHWL